VRDFSTGLDGDPLGFARSGLRQGHGQQAIVVPGIDLVVVDAQPQGGVAAWLPSF